MAQLWKGRFKKELAKETNDFNASIHFDSRMYKEDITGSMAHATMLGACGIIEKSESEKIVQGLSEILTDIESGKLAIDPGAEDIHTFVEGELTARLGQTGKRLHTARSRNDQVALDIRMTLKKEIDAIAADIKDLLAVLCKKGGRKQRCDPAGLHPFTAGAAHYLRPSSNGLCRHAVPRSGSTGRCKKTHECAAPGQRRSGRHHLPHRPANGSGAAGL